MIIFWLLLKDKVVEVEVNENELILYDGDEGEILDWTEIESIRQLIFIQPPLYKLRVKNREGYYLFVTHPFSINFGFGTIDLSEMGSFIHRKKGEYRF